MLINILSLCRDSFDGIMAQITHINIAEWLIKAGGLLVKQISILALLHLPGSIKAETLLLIDDALYV